MGGVECNIKGATRIKGIYAAGEAACVSLHGANRLGANSTAECLVWGKITGAEAGEYCNQKSQVPATPDDKINAEHKRLFEDLLNKKGTENLYDIRRELRTCMDMNVGVFRTGPELSTALEKVKSLRKRYANIGIDDKSAVYNTNLCHALETGNLLDLAEAMVSGALQRTESRGGHSRRDYKERDDPNWLKHTLAFYTEQGPRLDYKPVTITTWQPVERKY
jgi:succinate dehydrogenase / fumarate reductase flavoprotein subunit